MFSAAAHVTPFLLMEIIVQQSTVLVRAGIHTQDDYARALFIIELIMLKRDKLHISHEYFSVQERHWHSY